MSRSFNDLKILNEDIVAKTIQISIRLTNDAEGADAEISSHWSDHESPHSESLADFCSFQFQKKYIITIFLTPASVNMTENKKL